MFLKFFLLFFIFLPTESYATIVQDYNKSEKFLISAGYIPAEQTHAKYVVALLTFPFERFFCGGSIIGTLTILTAAHCVVNQKPYKIAIIAGTPNLYEKGESAKVVRVARIKVHPLYEDRNDSPHDLAIIQLRYPLNEDYETTQRISLTQSSPNIKDKCLIVGWGRIGHNLEPSDVLRYVEMEILPEKVCNEGLEPIEKTLCAGAPNGKVGGGCEGDSGGPIFCDGRLAGVLTGGFNCSAPDPTYFTDIYHYKEWIQENSVEDLKIGYKFGAAERNCPYNFIFYFFMYLFMVRVVRNS